MGRYQLGGVWAVPRQINVNWGKLRPPAKGEAGNSSLLPDETYIMKILAINDKKGSIN